MANVKKVASELLQSAKDTFQKFYSLARILTIQCQYYIIFGGRGDGKTTAGLLHIIEEYTKHGHAGVVIRQMDMDFLKGRGVSLMRSMEFGGDNKDENLIEKASGGKYTTSKFIGRSWFLGRREVDGDGIETVVWDKDPFCYAMALSQTKHDKGSTPPNVHTIVFDEFIPLDGVYLTDETVAFRNTVATIVRGSNKVKIFLFANSVTYKSPYFKMFGIQKDIPSMEKGDIRVYTYPQDRKDGSTMEMKVAVEYTETASKDGNGKDSDIYYIMADDRSAMITNGSFDIPEYPRCPAEFSSSNTKAVYWIITDEEVLRARLLRVGRDLFIFCENSSHAKMEARADTKRDLFYSLDFSSAYNHFTAPTMRYKDERTRYMADSIVANRIFFEDNETGENFMYYVRQAAKHNITTFAG